MVERRGRGEGTYQERSRGVYRLRVYVGRDPITGKPSQASRTVKARNDTEARKALRRFVAELEEGRVARVGRNATVEHLLKAWLDQLRDKRAQTTLESYRLLCDKHLIPALGKLELRAVTSHDLDRYYRACLDAGAKARTVRLRHSVLSGAFTQAVKWGWMDRNPARTAGPPAIPRGQGFIPDLEQVRRLIEAAGGDDDLATAVALAAITGCRRGELCGLKWTDWDRKTATLLLERQRVPVKGGDQTKPLKVGDGGPVALGAFGTVVLTRYETVIAERAERLGVEVDRTGWLISADCGRSPTNARWVSASIGALGKRTGIPVTPHAFRRFAATYMLAQGVDVRTAAGRLRHTPEMMLRVYAGFIPSRDESAAELLGAAISGAPDAEA